MRRSRLLAAKGKRNATLVTQLEFHAAVVARERHTYLEHHVPRARVDLEPLLAHLGEQAVRDLVVARRARADVEDRVVPAVERWQRVVA
jgi:hypothetical protein